MTNIEIQQAIVAARLTNPEAIRSIMARFEKQHPRNTQANAEMWLDDLMEKMEDKPASYFTRQCFIEAAAFDELAGGAQ
jgi:hypothetical protein